MIAENNGDDLDALAGHERRHRAPAAVTPIRFSERYRLVPAAVTPIRFSELYSAYIHHRRATGRGLFARDIASFLDAEYVATYTSYRRALCDCLLALKATDVDRTDVLIPAYSCPDFAAAVAGAGLTVQYCDMDPETLAIDMASIDELSTENTLAMITVNLLGFGNRMDDIVAFCDSNDIYLIEALGYSLGTEFGGRRLGTFGDFAVLNFQEGKAIPVGGGMVTTDREDFAISDEGRVPISPNYTALFGYTLFSHPRLYYLYNELSTDLKRRGMLSDRITTHPESKKNVDYTPPFATMSDFQGKLAHSVFSRLEINRRQRAQAARFYAEQLADCDHIQLVRPVRGVSKIQYIRYPIIVESPALRTEIRRALLDAGIQAVALYKGLEFDAERYPGSERLRSCILTLPTHPYVTPSDRQRIVDVIEKVTTASPRSRRHPARLP
jgi:perosamine synthetase